MDRTRARLSAWTCGVLLALGLAAFYSGRNASDLGVYHRTWQRVLAGQDIYHRRETATPDEPTAFLYPPPFAVLLAPLGRLPFRADGEAGAALPSARFVWAFVSSLAALRLVALSLALAGKERGPPARPLLAGGLTALVGLRFLIEDVGHGQVNTVVTALALEGAWRAETGRERSAAPFLAAAIALKLTPAILLLGWLLVGKRRATLECAGWLALVLLLPGLFVGTLVNLELLWRFATDVTAWNYTTSVAIPANASLTGAVHHYLVGFMRHQFDPVIEPAVGSFSPAVGRAASSALALLVLATCAAWILRARPGPAQRTAALLAAIPLVSPVIWKPHLVGLIPAWALSVHLLLGRTAGRAAGPQVVGMALSNLTTRAVIGRTLSDLSLRWGVVTLGVLATWLGALLAPAAPAEDEPRP